MNRSSLGSTKIVTKSYEVRLRPAVNDGLGPNGWTRTHGVGVDFRAKPTRPRGAYGRWQRFFVAGAVEKDIRPVKVLEELIDKYLALPKAST